MINILVQNVTSSIFGDFSGVGLKRRRPAGLTLIFSEVIPKSIGMANNEAISYRVAPILFRAQRSFCPSARSSPQ